VLLSVFTRLDSADLDIEVVTYLPGMNELLKLLVSLNFCTGSLLSGDAFIKD